MNITVRHLGDGRYAALLNGRVLCKSKTPFFTAARKLQREGIPDDTTISMLHEGADLVTLRSTVGYAAGNIVVESYTDGPKFGRYRPMAAQIQHDGVRHPPRMAMSNTEARMGG